MTTPAPHVPVSFLLAGGTAVFSADCVKALLACNINPNWIGSYGALQKRQEAARQVVDAHQATRRTGQNSPREPTFEERWLAASTAGHLQRDAPHRRGSRNGPKRSSTEHETNNCTVIVNGYTERGAMAMATFGNRNAPGTVEADVSAVEDRQAAARRAAAPPGSDSYSASDRRRDQNQCIDTAVDSHRRNFPRGLNNTPIHPGVNLGPAAEQRVAQDRAAAVRRANNNPAAALGNTSAAPVPAPRPGEATVPIVDNANKTAPADEQAKECLKAYRDALEQPAAQNAAIDQEIERQRARARDPAAMSAQAADMNAAERRVAAAREAQSAARANRIAAERTLREMPQAAKKQRQQALEQVKKAREAEARAPQAVAEAERARAHVYQMQPGAQIACLERQRAAIAPNQPGRIPGSGE